MKYDEHVTSAIRWNPTVVGDFLEGVFHGTDEQEGPYGLYTRYVFGVADRAYWTTGASVKECFARLKKSHNQPGVQMRLECIGVTDAAIEGRKIFSFKLSAVRL